jgi:hypothetical protein
MAAILEVVDSLPHIAFAQLLTDEPCHHGSNPLFPNDGVLGGFECSVVVVINSIESWRHFWLLGLEHLGFGGRHLEERGGDRMYPFILI